MKQFFEPRIVKVEFGFKPDFEQKLDSISNRYCKGRMANAVRTGV